MRLSFFLNWMGVVNMDFYERNNIPYTEETKYIESLGKEYTLKTYEKYYSCGRIDVHGHEEHPWGYEYGVGIMDNESWNAFGDWLYALTLEYLPDSVEEIVEMFEADTNFKINWWGGGDDEIH